MRIGAVCVCLLPPSPLPSPPLLLHQSLAGAWSSGCPLSQYAALGAAGICL